jgi:hypothetical protein
LVHAVRYGPLNLAAAEQAELALEHPNDALGRKGVALGAPTPAVQAIEPIARLKDRAGFLRYL